MKCKIGKGKISQDSRIKNFEYIPSQAVLKIHFPYALYYLLQYYFLYIFSWFILQNWFTFMIFYITI
jgi:hypothetical protein